MRTTVLICVLAFLLQACGSSPPAPIEDRRARYPGPAPVSYTVRSGDTLYGIAFTYGLDFRELAAINGIGAPYTIYPGQRLALKGQPKNKPSSSASASKPAPKPKPKPSQPQPVVSPSSEAAKKTTTVTKQSPSPVTNSASYAGGPVKSWRWPAQGRVSRGFSASVHKGIDIAGTRGDTVVATAAGKVVYAGTGIAGFGELLIVKHNEQYLSAYGHNDRLLVGEGDTVAAGQKIAEKGSSGTDTVKLHFEIRKDGKPIDPVRLLPRR